MRKHQAIRLEIKMHHKFFFQIYLNEESRFSWLVFLKFIFYKTDIFLIIRFAENNLQYWVTIMYFSQASLFVWLLKLSCDAKSHSCVSGPIEYSSIWHLGGEPNLYVRRGMYGSDLTFQC